MVFHSVEKARDAAQVLKTEQTMNLARFEADAQAAASQARSAEEEAKAAALRAKYAEEEAKSKLVKAKVEIK